MNLQQLRYLVAIAEYGTVTAAARAIPVAQPVLSRAIQALERELRVPLKRRSGRGVELTDVGLEAVALARNVLAGVDAIANIRAMHATPDQLRLVTQPLGVELVGPQLVDAQEWSVAFSIVTTKREALDQLDSWEADVAVVTGDDIPDRFVRIPAGQLEMFVMHRADLDLPAPTPMPMLSSHRLIWFPAGTDRGHEILEKLEQGGAVPETVPVNGDMLVWPAMVRSGQGVALATHARGVDRTDLAFTALDPPLVFPIVVAHRKFPAGDPRADAARTIAQHLAEIEVVRLDQLPPVTSGRR